MLIILIQVLPFWLILSFHFVSSVVQLSFLLAVFVVFITSAFFLSCSLIITAFFLDCIFNKLWSDKYALPVYQKLQSAATTTSAMPAQMCEEGYENPPEMVDLRNQQLISIGWIVKFQGQLLSLHMTRNFPSLLLNTFSFHDYGKV